jgi:pimeloyl-ACP methyl ester carboxylesterase
VQAPGASATDEIEERDLDAGEVRLRCALAGPSHGPLVVLLHGFPERGSVWRRVQEALARAGYRVAAPDLRGYGGSARPPGVEPYGIAHLVADVAGLVAALGRERAHVVGHDWGGVIAWWTAMLRPDVVDRLGIVNAAHPVGYATALRTFAQVRRSWYVFFFQLPWLPETVLAVRDYSLVRGFFSKDGIAAGDIEPCVDSLKQPGARSAAIAYYRASVRGGFRGATPKPARIDAPTLVVWGDRDRFLVPSLADPPREWVPGVRVVRLPNATHWAPIDAAGDVGERLLEHFG